MWVPPLLLLLRLRHGLGNSLLVLPLVLLRRQRCRQPSRAMQLFRRGQERGRLLLTGHVVHIVSARVMRCRIAALHDCVAINSCSCSSVSSLLPLLLVAKTA
jgi:hypothetical protein